MRTDEREDEREGAGTIEDEGRLVDMCEGKMGDILNGQQRDLNLNTDIGGQHERRHLVFFFVSATKETFGEWACSFWRSSSRNRWRLTHVFEASKESVDFLGGMLRLRRGLRTTPKMVLTVSTTRGIHVLSPTRMTLLISDALAPASLRAFLLGLTVR